MSSAPAASDSRRLSDYQHEVVRISPSDCPAVEEALGDFDEPEIRGCRANQKDEEKRRWRDEIEPPAHREKRKNHRDGDRPKRHGHEESVRPAPEEPPPRTDGEDHEDLGGNRLYEPAGLEQRLAGAEQVQQSVEGQKI